ncbi:MAG TPA: hypothetical protein VFX19_09125 [Dehalococcoidia bacterium]|jgi:hypothetical protein|nr:hypothetical protein [Dehalococcoidia bacterium]
MNLASPYYLRTQKPEVNHVLSDDCSHFRLRRGEDNVIQAMDQVTPFLNCKRVVTSLPQLLGHHVRVHLVN